MKIESDSLAKRDLWPLSSGQLAVRPGLRRHASLTNSGAWVVAGGFSLRNRYTNEIWHYVLHNDVSTEANLTLSIYDDRFSRFQALKVGTSGRPRAVGGAEIQGMLTIGSPDMPTLWGLVGSSMRFAVKQASDNSTTTAIAVPRGLVTRWVNRVAVANGNTQLISDPVAITGGDPRTFVAQNNNEAPAALCFGQHVGAGGMLVTCTSDGVWGLPEDAAAVQLVSESNSAWRLLSHHPTLAYETTCAVNGRLYGLTKRGFRLIDTEDGEETFLDEPYMTRLYGKRISIDDYRSCRIYGGDLGPIVVCEEQRAACFVDSARGFASWWTEPDTSMRSLAIRGLLRGDHGQQLLLTADGAYEAVGNFDGTTALSGANATQPFGLLHGVIAVSPAEEHTVRQIHVAASGGTADAVRAAVRGDGQTAACYNDPRALIIGADAWGAAAPKKYATAAMGANRLSFDVNSADMALEVGTTTCLSRLSSTIIVDESGSAKNRPQDRG